MSNGKHDANTRLSMKLSGILRHGKDGFTPHIDKHGWVDISTLLEKSHYCQLHHVTYEQIADVVKSNEKQRFKISEDGLRIKANQGHTIDIDDESLQKMTLEQASTYTAIVHGTYYRVMHPIVKSGLSRMKRNHIHLTASDRVDASIGVISGFRGSCDILIYVDVCSAMHDGIDFYISENNVILCAGDEDGILKPKYFHKVVDRHSKRSVDVLTKCEQLSTRTSGANKTETTGVPIEKQLKQLRRKIKETDKINANIKSGKILFSELEKNQVDKLSKRKEFEEAIEQLSNKGDSSSISTPPNP